MTGCKLEPATHAADHRALAKLAREIWHEHYPGIISIDQIEYMLASGYSARAMAAEQAVGTRFVRARIGDDDVGFASVSPDADDAALVWLDKLYVRRANRGHGVGRALLDWAHDNALALDAQALCLRVNRHNRGAVAVYEKTGFRVDRADVKSIGHGFVMDDYIMHKALIS